MKPEKVYYALTSMSFRYSVEEVSDTQTSIS
jgi:hypothetical protein